MEIAKSGGQSGQEARAARQAQINVAMEVAAGGGSLEAAKNAREKVVKAQELLVQEVTVGGADAEG